MDSHLTIRLDAGALEPLVAFVVQQAQRRLETILAQPGDRLAYDEKDAAALLGLKQHQLRDARRAGKIRCAKVTGRRIRYRREDLLRYLEENAD